MMSRGQGLQMKSSRSISAVLAGYNEESNIDRSMGMLYDSLENHFEKFELILIDDASTDSTLEKMLRFAKMHKDVRVLPNYANLNFGSSVLRGLMAARNDFVIYNACDLPLSVDDMARLIIDMPDGIDVLVLERTGYKTTHWRGITSNVNKLLLKILFPGLTKGTPVLNFVQIYKKNVLKEIVPLARSPIFVWPELVFRAKLGGFAVKNVQAKYSGGTSVRRGAFGHPHDIIWGIYDMLRFRIRLWGKSY